MLVQYIYKEAEAAEYASIRKHLSNSGPRIQLDDFKEIDDELSDLVGKKGQSIEAAWHLSEALQKVSSLTIRRDSRP